MQQGLSHGQRAVTIAGKPRSPLRCVGLYGAIADAEAAVVPDVCGASSEGS